MRSRALLFLLALTAGDYLLWRWSIAGGHDVLSLLAGLTLVPLAAVSAGRLALAGARLLSDVAGRRSSTALHTARASRGVERTQHSPRDSTAKSDSPSGRLAA